MGILRQRPTVEGRLNTSRLQQTRGLPRKIGSPYRRDYYPDLVREFYANMTHKTNKDLQTIISIVNGVRIILDRESPDTPFLGSQKPGVRSPWIQTEKQWTRTRTGISIWLVAIFRSSHGHWTVAESSTGVRISPSKEDRLRDRNPAGFCSIKKTTQTDLGASSLQPVENNDEADESYNPSDDEEDENEMQLMEIVESTRRYADELAHKRASIDRQKVMLAQLCQRFMPHQCSNGGGGTNFGPQ
ncbi:hypothetical protein M9H77_30669 [Catharanthus roseus]|uniref:Uncharacterized protein n=1 Tax=Catharanthus roseus TaxID=4058 RepID=A0ACB9ZZ74_CATRO|nr:hypothetical protein M9H77_30669 [Catharanthus roseus]